MRNSTILRAAVWLTFLSVAPAISQWTPPVSILPEAMPSSPDFGDPPAIAPMIATTATAEALHLVWSQEVAGNIEIFHSRQQSGSWSTPVNVSKAAGVSVFPAMIASADGVVHLAWTEFYEDSAEVYYASLSPSTAWPPPIKLTEPDAILFHAFPVLAANAMNEVHCFWSNIIEDNPSDQRSLSHRKKPANGQWTAPLATPQAEVHAFRPSILFDRADILHCVWYDGETAPQRRIDYSFLSNSGWSTPQTLAKGAISDDLPIAFAATSDNALHIWAYDYLAASGFSIIKNANDWQEPRLLMRSFLNGQFVAAQNDVHAIYQTLNGIEYAVFKNSEWGPGSIFQDMNAALPTITSDEKSLYAFWLKNPPEKPEVFEIRYSQMSNISNVQERVNRAVPHSFQLLPAHPNPFNRTTEMVMNLHTTAAVELAIFDVQGHQVRTLMSGQAQTGWHGIQWDGTDDSGRIVANGIYFVRLQAFSNGGGRSVLSRAVLFLKN